LLSHIPILTALTVFSFEDRMRQGGASSVSEATRFFMRDDPVHQTLRALAQRLDCEGIPYRSRWSSRIPQRVR
jgi:hypothetical protein